jgi:peptidyl-prolyl cis-trans isomerase D
MFIAHGGWVRKHARWILVVVLVILIPGFIALFTRTGGVERRGAELPKVKGKPVNHTEFEKARTAVVAQFAINTGQALSRSQEFEDQLARQAVVRLLLLHKARDWGIRVSDEDLVAAIRAQPLFQGQNGQYDRTRYQQVLIFLNNYGISEVEFEEVMRDDIAIGRLQALVTSGAKVSPLEVVLAYDPLYEKISIDYVQFDAADYESEIEVTDEDAENFYQQNEQMFRRPEQVKVRYVEFSIEQAKKSIALTDAEIAEYYEFNKTKYINADQRTNSLESVKEDIRQELTGLRAQRLVGDQATEFTVKLVHEPGAQRPDFVQLAGEFGAEVKETGYFGPQDEVAGIQPGTQFNQAAFILTHDLPFSDPVASTNSYYVLEFLDRKPSAIPPFQEVKEQVLRRLKAVRALEAARKAAQETVQQVKDAMMAGESFVAACEAIDLEVVSPEPFDLAESATELPNENLIKEVAMRTPTGAVTDYIQTSTGAVFFHLKQRTPPDAEQFAARKTQFERQILARNRQALWDDWREALLREEQVAFGPKQPGQQQPPAATQPRPAS